MITPKPTISAETMNAPESRQIDYVLESKKKINFTSEYAYKILDLPTFDGEREVRDRHVDHLVSEAKNGNFLAELASIVTCLCEWDGQIRRLNGQHTCWMRLFMPEDWNIQIEVVHYRVPSWEDFRRLYCKIDQGAARSKSHQINALLVGVPGYENVPNSYLKAMAKAVPVYLDNYRLDAVKISELIKGEHAKLVTSVISFMISRSISKSFRRASVWAAMLATFNRSASDAEQFWSLVNDGLNFKSKKDPCYVLREFLLQVAERRDERSEGRIANQKRLESEEVFRGCILAWNAFRRKEEISFLKVGAITKRQSVR